MVSWIKNRRGVIIAVVSVAIVLAVGLWFMRPPETGPFVGNRLPDFALMDRTGTPVSRADLDGRPLLINFWATWCEPCRDEMPEIERIHQASDGSFDIIAVTDEPLPVAERFFDELELSLPLYVDADRSFFQELLIRFMPTTYFVDGSGVIQSIWIGEMDRDVLLANLSGIVSADTLLTLQ